MSLPLLIGGVCIITSIIGTYFVRLGQGQSIMGALYKGFWTAILIPPSRRSTAPAWYALGGDLKQDDHDHRVGRASPAPTCSGACSSASPSPR
jgi:Na+/H+-translocating membrane pyrophosphatase